MARGGEQHDGGGRELRQEVNFLDESETIHVGHVPVNKDERKMLTGVSRGGELRERGVTTADRRGVHLPASEKGLEDAPIRPIVIYNQDFDATQRFRGDERFFRNGGVGAVECNRKMEIRAASGLAFQPDFAAHHIHKA